MNQDERCCGSGTCIINAEGLCWCGQQWNGTAMCRPAAPQVKKASASAQRQPEENHADSANPAKRDTP